MKVFSMNKATRHWMWEKRLKLVELERLTGMTRMTLAGYNGASVKVSTCEKIAESLGIELIEFIESGLVEKE